MFSWDDVNSSIYDIAVFNSNYFSSPDSVFNNTTDMSIFTTHRPNLDTLHLMAYIYFYLTAVMSFLSILGTTAIVVTYCAFKELRTTGRTLLVYLSVADFLTASGNLLGIIWYIMYPHRGNPGGKWLCQLNAALTIGSSISSFFWNVAMATHLYVCIRRRDVQLADKLTIPFHVVCWTLPATIAVVAWSCDVLGHGSKAVPPFPSWCWIGTDKGEKWSLFWQYMTGKAWEIHSYVITAVLYILVNRTLYKQIKMHQSHTLLSTTSAASKRSNRSLMVDANSKLTFVPLVFVSLRVWGTIRFIVEAHFFHVIGNSLFWIVPLQGVGDSAQGFANCLMFCVFTSSIRHRCIAMTVGCCRPRCFRRLNQDIRSPQGLRIGENHQSNVIGESPSPETSVPHNDDSRNLIKLHTTIV